MKTIPNNVAILENETRAAQARGWPLTPTRGKRPYRRCWQTEEPLLFDALRVCYRQGEGAALRTGVTSGVLVLDKDGDNLPAGFEVPKTPTVETARGRHFYLAYPNDRRIGCKTHVGGYDLDVRGEGGAAVYPGSRHESGHIYRWADGLDPDSVPLAPAPGWLLDLLEKPNPEPRHSTPSTRTPADLQPYTRAALEGETAKVAAAHDGMRNDTLNRAAHALGGLEHAGLARETAAAALLDAAVACGLPEGEAAATFQSGWTAGTKSPRVIEDQTPAPRNGKTLTMSSTEPDTQPENKDDQASGNLPVIYLPSEAGRISFSECAGNLFRAMAKSEQVFFRGGRVAEIIENAELKQLSIVKPEGLCSLAERFARLKVHRAERNGGGVYERFGLMPSETAKKLLATAEARELLPEIAGVANAPILTVAGKIHSSGYDPESGWFITSNTIIDDVALDTAHCVIESVLRDFHFQKPNDRSRALASILSPALRLGGHIDRCPAFLFEADESQTGKGYLGECITAIYNERPALIARREGGVGSFDESLGIRLSQGRPFPMLDNFRGTLGSEYLESLLTAEKSFDVRLPHIGEITVDPSRFCVLMTSNGVLLTKDMANRVCAVRLQKQSKGYEWATFPEGDLKAHIRANWPRFLGAVYAVAKYWIDQGRPATKESRHDFRGWVRVLDWIVQNVFDAAPLMDDHQDAQKRLSDSGASFLRELAAALDHQDCLDRELSASDLAEFCNEFGVTLPNARGDLTALVMGRVLHRTLGDEKSVNLEAYTLQAGSKDVWREDKSCYRTVQTYIFFRGEQGFPLNPPNSYMGQKNRPIFQSNAPIEGIEGEDVKTEQTAKDCGDGLFDEDDPLAPPVTPPIIGRH